MSDYLELARLVIEISWRIDHGKADTVAELFVEDGELDLGKTIFKGREEIREWGRKVVNDPQYRGIRHACTNMRFLSLGQNSAEGFTLVMAYMRDRDGSRATLPFAVGEDHDRYLRTDQGWRMVSRAWQELYSR